MRLDQYVVEKSGLSRNIVQTLIQGGDVEVDGKIIKKRSYQVTGDEKIEILKDKLYVSRAGEKLLLFLRGQNIDFRNKNVLDIGASTGGFTEVLLEQGVNSVTALDIGTLQLSEKLRNNPKVTSIENMDIRNFQSLKSFDIVTCDVSFISLHHILNDIDRLSSGTIIVLFKPQFEVGRDIKRDSRGVVLDENAVDDALQKFIDTTNELGWHLESLENSKVLGREGNREIFLSFRK
jgi:23S rRNA (cytidine1920-2'-O)/16S rRNA (cytidine1409-2'-O)-methyltransferase